MKQRRASKLFTGAAGVLALTASGCGGGPIADDDERDADAGRDSAGLDSAHDGAAGDGGGIACPSGGGAGGDLIYLMDQQYRLISFDPRLIGNGAGADPFQVIGQVACPAGPSVPGWPVAGAATPFSLAIDRQLVAHVLYTSGQIFDVSTVDATCTPTGFEPAQIAGGRRWDLFSMSYVTDASGGDAERVWIAGGNAGASMTGDLGWLDPGDHTVHPVGSLSNSVEYTPELAGLGDATLWGFYPGAWTAFVQQIDKTTGAGTGPVRSIPGGLGGTVSAWAFAHHDGVFYVFATAGIIETTTLSTIDRSSGQYTLLWRGLPYKIVGAAAPTCAPV